MTISTPTHHLHLGLGEPRPQTHLADLPDRALLLVAIATVDHVGGTPAGWSCPSSVCL